MKLTAITLIGAILSLGACAAPDGGKSDTSVGASDHDTDRLRHRDLSPRHAKWLGSTQSGPSR